MLPLAGVKVIDLTSVAMGPFASQWLGDFGADIVKVEAPQGDTTRNTGPGNEPGMAAIYLGTNRNKRSIILDLKRTEAREALLKLVDTADIFMHSVRPQKLRKLGLDPDALLARNPRLVYAGFHGFAEAGPYGGRPAYDDIIQGLCGSAALMRQQSGEARYFPTIMADKTTGVIGAIAILAALRGRDASGKGSYVEIPMFESMVAFNLQEHFYGAHFVPPLAPPVYPRVMSPSRKPHKTIDSYICVMPYTDAHWRDFFAEVGTPEIAFEERFTGISRRTQNIDALYALAAQHIATKTTAEWIDIFNRLQIPAAPMLELVDLLEDEHLAQTGFFEVLDDEKIGKVRFTGVPVLIDGERLPINFPPRLGEHGRIILAEAGLTEEEINTVLSEPRHPTQHESTPA
ncbi:CoA transferase [Sphingobium sp. Sx8-8]|uniref:CaiB/BaiF CoA transferase family protein n=1 Tax=Sphingobium sp. Sx8-8 TaxID=2933617 RepID=UPI001F5A7B83|nr:CoA transferase [Sphingobium sp. Sx8-8]